jgi:DNA-directed RNA polymerase specialized sigma24 family protein
MLHMAAPGQPRRSDHMRRADLAEDAAGVPAAFEVPVPDSAIIEASLCEPERFAELFNRHAAVLHRYVVRRLGPDQAEDVVAETFTRAFEKRRKYAFDRSDALPWLYGITTNIIGTHRRAEVRSQGAKAGRIPVYGSTPHTYARSPWIRPLCWTA